MLGRMEGRALERREVAAETMLETRGGGS